MTPEIQWEEKDNNLFIAPCRFECAHMAWVFNEWGKRSNRTVFSDAPRHDASRVLRGMTMTPATDAQVTSYILQLLDDYKPHDWDDTMIAVSVGCEAVGLSLYARQEDTCLYKLIRLGEVKERWRGDMATLQRIRVPIPVERLQKTLW